MFKDLETLKKELSDLAPLVNAFKSESVQLKIIECIFHGSINLSGNPQIPEAATGASAKDKPITAKNGKPKRTGSSKLGPVKILQTLIDEGFFKKPQTIAQIIEHASSKKAVKLKATGLSGPLARYTRDNALERKKNAESQYEYSQK